MADHVYIKLSESCLADNKKVRIKDVATVVSNNPDMKYGIEKTELFSFTGTKEQKVISVMYIIENSSFALETALRSIRSLYTFVSI